MMKSMLLAAALTASTLFTAPMFAQATVGYVVPITGTVNHVPQTGTFTIKQFQNINGTLNAVGTLTMHNVSTSLAIPVTASNPTGVPTSSNAITSASSEAISAAPAAASCPVLNLVLGPLNLNVLGLVVTLNQVNLNITAIPGAGNLLGNLLCDVAGLLNPGGGGLNLSSLVTVLNQLLAAL
jgi:hypothetical protein